MDRTSRTRPGDKTDKRPAELPLPSAKKSTNPSEDASLSIQDTSLSSQAEPLLLSEGNINLLTSSISTSYEARQASNSAQHSPHTEQSLCQPGQLAFRLPLPHAARSTLDACAGKSLTGEIAQLCDISITPRPNEAYHVCHLSEPKPIITPCPNCPNPNRLNHNPSPNPYCTFSLLIPVFLAHSYCLEDLAAHPLTLLHSHPLIPSA